MVDYELIDTHCHLYLEDFSGDLPEYLSRARDQGITRIYLPSLDLDHFNDMMNLQIAYPEICRAMVGVHPCYVKADYERQLDFMQEALADATFAAVGEIGLDYYWDRTFDEQQMICFKEQIRMAKENNLPVVIHCRNAMQECTDILKSEKGSGLRGIFHCFSGTYENAVDIIDCGFYLGIGGVVTYKNAGLAEVVAKINLDHIVLETDAPYLTPVPFRGKRNESSYLKYVVEKIALVKGVDISEVATATTRNALSIFTT